MNPDYVDTRQIKDEHTAGFIGGSQAVLKDVERLQSVMREKNADASEIHDELDDLRKTAIAQIHQIVVLHPMVKQMANHIADKAVAEGIEPEEVDDFVKRMGY